MNYMAFSKSPDIWLLSNEKNKYCDTRHLIAVYFPPVIPYANGQDEIKGRGPKAIFGHGRSTWQ